MPLPHNLGLPRHMDRARSVMGEWALIPKPQITFEYVVEPEFWVHILQSEAVVAGDRVFVRAEDWLYCAELIFVQVDENRMWAKTRVLHLHWNNLASEIVKDKDGWEVNYGGMEHKWRIVSPAGVLADKGYTTRAEAEAARENIKSARVAKAA